MFISPSSAANNSFMVLNNSNNYRPASSSSSSNNSHQRLVINHHHQQPFNSRHTTATTSAYSTSSTTPACSSMLALNGPSQSHLSIRGRQQTPAAIRQLEFQLGNSRPTFPRSRSCDLIISGQAIQPSAALPPPPHLRHKFTTLAAVGQKPTTKPLPFSFSISTMCHDGSCKRFLEKKKRYAKCYDESFETIVQQHARISRNLDKLAGKIRRIFNGHPKAGVFQPSQRPRLRDGTIVEPIVEKQYHPEKYSSDIVLHDTGPDWDLGELVKNAEVLSRNLEQSSKILAELAQARDEMLKASHNHQHVATGGLKLQKSLSRHSSHDNDDGQLDGFNTQNMTSNLARAHHQQHKLETQLSTIKIIGAQLERKQFMLRSSRINNQYDDSDDESSSTENNQPMTAKRLSKPPTPKQQSESWNIPTPPPPPFLLEPILKHESEDQSEKVLQLKARIAELERKLSSKQSSLKSCSPAPCFESLVVDEEFTEINDLDQNTVGHDLEVQEEEGLENQPQTTEEITTVLAVETEELEQPLEHDLDVQEEIGLENQPQTEEDTAVPVLETDLTEEFEQLEQQLAETELDESDKGMAENLPEDEAVAQVVDDESSNNPPADV